MIIGAKQTPQILKYINKLLGGGGALTPAQCEITYI